MSERYALVFSGFLLLMAGALFAKVHAKVGIAIILAVIVLLGIWNIIEVIRVGGDWQKASDISVSTLTTMNTKFFPLKGKKLYICEYADPVRACMGVSDRAF